MAAAHLIIPNYDEVLASVYEALGAGDVAEMTRGLLDLSLVVDPPGIPRVEVQERLKHYDEIRELAPRHISVQTPDMMAIALDWKDIVMETRDPATSSRAANLHRQLFKGSFLWKKLYGFSSSIYNDDGVPKQMTLWSNALDLVRPFHDPWRITMGWRILLSSTRPLFFPGDYSAVIITSTLLDGGETCLKIGVDGNNGEGAAARAFLPLKVTQVEHAGLFFHFADANGLRYDVEVAKIFAHVAHNKANSVALMLGVADIQEAVLLGLSEDEIVDLLWGKLVAMSAKLAVRIYFCGLIPWGPAAVQSMVEAVHHRLFGLCHLLREHNIVFFDCSSPAPSMAAGAYQFDGSLTVEFKATALFGMSRVIAMSIHNLVNPLPWQAPGEADRLRAIFWNQRRAMIV